MIRDTINSIRLTMSERIGNPLISSALVACIVINWKLSLLLLSGVPYDEKVAKISQLYATTSAQFEDLLLKPIFFGLLWTIIWPALSILINAYWYWMRANIGNVRLWAERKKRISEAEAAELYSTIDSQEGKYLELLKDRQSRIDELTLQIKSSVNERKEVERELSSARELLHELKQQLEDSREKLRIKNEEAGRHERNSDTRRQLLEEIYSRSLDFAAYLPGLKAITNAVNKSVNFQASETWVKEEFSRQEPSLTAEDRQKMLNLFLALNLFKKTSDGDLTFGDQYRFVKDKILGMYNNSPGQRIPHANPDETPNLV